MNKHFLHSVGEVITLNTTLSFISVVSEGWCDGTVTSYCCSHEKPSGQRSHTCHMSAWDSKCFALPRHSGQARLWLDRSLRWLEWQPWYFLIRRSPRWSKAMTKRGSVHGQNYWIYFHVQLNQYQATQEYLYNDLLHSWQNILPGSRSLAHRSYQLPEENTGEGNMIIVTIWLTEVCWLCTVQINYDFSTRIQEYLGQVINSLLVWHLK